MLSARPEKAKTDFLKIWECHAVLLNDDISAQEANYSKTFVFLPLFLKETSDGWKSKTNMDPTKVNVPGVIANTYCT